MIKQKQSLNFSEKKLINSNYDQNGRISERKSRILSQASLDSNAEDHSHYSLIINKRFSEPKEIDDLILKEQMVVDFKIQPEQLLIKNAKQINPNQEED